MQPATPRLRPEHMKHIATALVAGAVLVLAAGCAHQAATAGAGSSVAPVTLSAPPATTAPGGSGVVGPVLPNGQLPPGAVLVPATQVDASALPRAYPRQVWTDSGGQILGLTGEQGGCTSSSARLTQQTAAQVTVLVQQGSTAGGESRECPMYLTYKPIEVHLSAPLGQRMVVLQLQR